MRRLGIEVQDEIDRITGLTDDRWEDETLDVLFSPQELDIEDEEENDE